MKISRNPRYTLLHTTIDFKKDKIDCLRKNYTSKKSYNNYKNHKNKMRGRSTPSQAKRTEEKCAATAARMVGGDGNRQERAAGAQQQGLAERTATRNAGIRTS